MNRKELVRRIANVMRENNIRKPVSSQKQVSIYLMTKEIQKTLLSRKQIKVFYLHMTM